jgi:STE24 endopeptidase
LLNCFVYFWNFTGVIVSASGYDTNNEILRSAALMLVMNIFNTLVGLPFSVYHTFVLEEKHGFNKQVSEIFVYL